MADTPIGSSPLAGMTVVVTGAMAGNLQRLTRNEMNERTYRTGRRTLILQRLEEDQPRRRRRRHWFQAGQDRTARYRLTTPDEFATLVANLLTQWRNVGMFAAIMEGMIGEAARRGQADISLVSVLHGSPRPSRRGRDAVTSDGEFFNREFITEGEAFRYRRLQQRLARHKRGSTNRHKTITAMGRIMSRVTDRRGEFCAQAAAHPAQMNALIALEDLRIKNMPASAAGTLNEPGRRVAQKRGPNQDFGVVGWYPVHDDPSGGKPWE